MMSRIIPFSRPLNCPPDRAWRWACVRTLRDLRISIERNRPISLPNLLRLYRRRVPDAGWEDGRIEAGLDHLRGVYLRGQPFTNMNDAE
jgi:hypothetical protein